jgi:uncharacterized protein YfaS (alpha-2-macroglobulin family)
MTKIPLNAWYAPLIKLLVGASVLGILASAQAAPAVTDFGPIGMQRDVRQVRLRFSDEMAALGDTRAADAATVSCTGMKEQPKGRWIDGLNWVAEFQNGLSDGVSCAVKPTALKTLKGETVATTAPWKFNTGGPRIRTALSLRTDWQWVAEDPITAFQISIPADAATLKYLACRVGDKHPPVQILAGAKRNEIFSRLWLREHNSKPEDALNENWIVAQCGTQAWPNGAQVTWIWDKKIAALGGMTNSADEPYRMFVRPAFSNSIECKQLAGSIGCDPRADVSFKFSEQVEKALGEKIIVRGSSGKTYTFKQASTYPYRRRDPDGSIYPNGRYGSQYDSIGPMEEGESLAPVWPSGFTDIDGRILKNISETLTPVPVSHLPAYLGMAQSRGVIQWKPGQKVLWPLAARNTEKNIPVHTWNFGNAMDATPALLALHDRAESLSLGRLGISNTAMMEEPFASSSALLHMLPGPQPQRTEQIVEPSSSTMEFIGIPLSGYGTWLIEADSPAYRAAVELQWNSLPVHHAQYSAWEYGRMALVQLTNLNITARISTGDTSLVWLTAVDTGKPVANATVEVWSCERKQLIQARTDAEGRVLINKLIVPSACLRNQYNNYATHDLWIVARSGQDISVLHSVGMDTNSIRPEVVGHTVLDRVLFRAGDTVSMQHLARFPVADGWAIPSELKGTLSIFFNYSELVEKQDLIWQKDGSAFSTWKIPVSAKLGNYRFVVEDEKGGMLTRGQFQIEEFRNPVFDARLNGVTKWQDSQQTLILTGGLSFMAGGPAAAQTVVLKGEYTHGAEPPVRGYSFENVELQSKDFDFAKLNLILDKKGQLESSVRAPVTDKPITLRAEMQFADPNGETQTEDTEISIWPQRHKTGLRVRASLKPMTAEISVTVLDEHNRPLGNQAVTIDATEADSGGNVPSVDSNRFAVCTVHTDALGQGQCEVPWNRKAERQYWLFRAQVDGASTASMMVYKNTFTWTRSKDVLERVNAAAPKAGEIDRLRVRAPFLPATLLLTMEREGVFTSQVRYLTKEEEELDLPTQSRFAPAVNVIAHFVRGSEQLSAKDEPGVKLTDQATLSLIFDQVTHALQVEVKSASVARPGQTVRANVKVTHEFNGRPAAGARVTMVAFDDSLTTLKPNLTWSVIQHFWNMRYEKVYGVDLGARRMPAQTFGKKPEFWPNFETWVSRVGTVLRAVTPSQKLEVIQLPSPIAAPIEQVITTGIRASLQQSLNQKKNSDSIVEVITAEDVGKMPDKNVADSLQRAPDESPQFDITPRTDFSSLALWKTDVVLNARGEATIDVPLKDSLTRWRFVAVAMDGTDRYGYGSTLVQTRKDIQIISGLPQTVRSDDVLRQKLTIRNTGEKSVNVQLSAVAKATLNPDIPRARDPVPPKAMEVRGLKLNKTIQVAAGENRVVEWPVAVPDGVTQLDWTIKAQVVNSQDGDAMTFKQTIVPVAPVTVRDSTMLQIDSPHSITVAQPPGARPGTGGIAVRWQASLVEAAINGARNWMGKYPYLCMEQRSSKAAVSGDPAQWEQAMALLPQYMDSSGLVAYFPSLHGSEILTAYLLDLSDAYQLPLPAPEKEKMQMALRTALTRQDSNDWLPDNDKVVYRLALQAAIAHNLGGAKPTVPPDLNRLPTIALLDWVRYVLTTPDTAERKTRLDAAASQLRNRYDMHGTRLVWRDGYNYNLWWMMWSHDAAVARTALVVQQWLAVDARWKDDVPRLIQGLVDTQHNGSWSTTTGNAWGVAAMQRFAKNTEQGPVTGISHATFGGATNDQTWPEPEKMLLPWPQQGARDALDLSHTGSGAPWATVQITAAMKIDAPIEHGVSVRKTISAVEQKIKNQWSEGDVIKVSLEITSQSDLSWLVVNDPIPSGATILGKSLGRESQLALSEAKIGTQWWWRPSSEERANDGYRGYYERVWRGSWTTEYIVRLNNVGTFNFPATRVEAMYSPEIFGETPNATLEVKP